MRCLACGSECAPAARFCSECGERLRDPVLAAGSSERRQLTVMFCDLVDSTRLSLELDAEDFTNAISAYRDVCARVVTHWRGYVSRYVGDGVLAYFGYPRASDDDALRGVCAAWELLRGIAELRPALTSSVRGGAGLRLRARVGLHTGLAVVGDVVGRDSAESAGVLGAVPNIAARLQGFAQPGQVVVSDATATLLPASIRLGPLAGDTQPERIGPTRAYAVVDVPHDSARRRALSNATLLGRQAVIERIVALLDAGEAAPAGVLVVGEAGVGKSRLVQEVRRRAPASTWPWVELACSPYGQTSPLLPFREWLTGEAAGDVLAPVDAGGDRGDAGAVADAPGDEAITPFRRRQRTFENLRAGLGRLGPRVGILVEDLHWADSTTVEFVAELVSPAQAGRFVVLLTSRRPPDGVLATTAGLRTETLDRLAAGDAASLVRALTTAKPLSSYEVAEIVAHAEGVPLYIEEFVRALSSTDHGPDRIPLTLRDSLMAVLDTLGDGRSVALCASIFGRRFHYRQLRQLIGVPDGELEPTVAALVDARILVRSGALPEAWLEFRHALLRDTAYHTLLKSERERLHRRAAQLANDAAAPVEAVMPELLATHYSLGGDHRKAIDHWIRAHGLATQRSANDEALAHVRRGLDDCQALRLLDTHEADRLELELLRRIVNPLIAISGWSTSELEQVYRRAVALCRRVGGDDAAFELQRGRFNVHLLRSELRRAEPIARHLVASAQACDDPDRREQRLLVALRARALPPFYRASFDVAKAWLNRVLDLYDAHRHADHATASGIEPAALAMSYLAWIDAASGRHATSRDFVDAAVRHAKTAGHPFSTGYALCFAASCAQIAGDPRSAAAHADEALRIGNQHNFQYWIAWAKAVKGWVTGLDAPDEGVNLIDDALLAYAATGSTLVAPYFDALACNVRRLERRGGDASREAALRSRARETGVWFWEAALAARPG